MLFFSFSNKRWKNERWRIFRHRLRFQSQILCIFYISVTLCTISKSNENIKMIRIPLASIFLMVKEIYTKMLCWEKNMSKFHATIETVKNLSIDSNLLSYFAFSHLRVSLCPFFVFVSIRQRGHNCLQSTKHYRGFLHLFFWFFFGFVLRSPFKDFMNRISMKLNDS